MTRGPQVVRTVTGAAGVGVIGYGIYGLLNDPYIRDPLSVLFWGLGGLVLHDGFWLPLVLLAGTVLVRRPLLRAGLVVAAALTAVGLPAELRAGVDHGNASLLPLPYLRNWLLSLAAVAVVVGAIAVAPKVPPALRRMRLARRARLDRRARRRAERRA
ncbi:hypothetical protein ABIA32_001801 [Streptacidiphilus sp. MAP12-20]|uniref:hypothetical protein n=1 Tax=Streptacidiphilus sp. MAP12-20 TaxID=3156299 RepID=UPI0035171A84